MAPRGVHVLDLRSAEVPAPPYAVFSEGLIDRIQPEGWL
jgi:hypothetical protein